MHAGLKSRSSVAPEQSGIIPTKISCRSGSQLAAVSNSVVAHSDGATMFQQNQPYFSDSTIQIADPAHSVELTIE